MMLGTKLSAEAASRAVGLARRCFRPPRLNRVEFWCTEIMLGLPHPAEELAEQLVEGWPSPDAALEALAAVDVRTGVTALALAALETGQLPERLPDGWHARLEYRADRPERGAVAELVVDVAAGERARRHCVVVARHPSHTAATIVCAQAVLEPDEARAARFEWEQRETPRQDAKAR